MSETGSQLDIVPVTSLMSTDSTLGSVWAFARGTDAQRTNGYVERVPQGDKPEMDKKPAGSLAPPESGLAGVGCVVLTGGGSGGHITPLLAVAHELKKSDSDTNIVYIGERGGRLGDVASGHASVDQSYRIFAGKLRRYHGEGLRQLLDIPTMLKNIRDVLYLFLGLCQAIWVLMRIKPSVIFIKGSLVGVPVGWAAALLRIPYVTHDSDAIPGLANRLVARWAKVHAVALSKKLYPYSPDKTIEVGVPVSPDFQPVSTEAMQKFRHDLGITEAEQVVFVTGGGLGAVRLNNAVIAITESLLTQFPNLYLLHSVGRGQVTAVQASYDNLSDEMSRRIIVKDFVHDLFRYSGAADVVVTRCSATALMEFAAQGKACIAVPNPLLTGGHQLKNAKYFKQSESIIEVSELDLQRDTTALLPAIRGLLLDPAGRRELAHKLGLLAHPNAAVELTQLLFKYAKKSRT